MGALFPGAVVVASGEERLLDPSSVCGELSLQRLGVLECCGGRRKLRFAAGLKTWLQICVKLNVL